MLACSASSICHLETLGVHPIWSNSAATQTTKGRLLTSSASAGMGRYTLDYITPFGVHQPIALFVLSDCYETQSLASGQAQCSVYEKRLGDINSLAQSRWH